MTLKENYNRLLNKIKEILKDDGDYLTDDSKKSLEILLFKIETQENKDKMLLIISNEFNLFGEVNETPIDLLRAKKIKLDNVFKKNVNFI